MRRFFSRAELNVAVAEGVAFVSERPSIEKGIHQTAATPSLGGANDHRPGSHA
jgi:hypothetical protein